MDEFFLAGTEPHDLAPLDAGPTTDGSDGTAAADASAAEPDPEPSPPETPMVLPILAPDGA
jgi:hypothetical protein